MNKIRKSMSVLFVSVFVLAACGTTAPAPVPKAQLYSPVIAAAAGVWASYAILSCGSLYGWGGGLCGLGEFSDCRDVNAIEFAPLRIMADVVAISANGAPVRTDTLAGRTTLWPHAMAIDTQGNLWGWGYNRLGQLGIGSIEAQRSPVLIMTDIIAVSAGSMHTLAIDKNNTLWAWGNNEYGQLGNGNKKLQARPVAVMDNIAMVSAGINHSVALDAEGYLWTWGLPALVGDGRGRYGACQNVPYRLMGDVIYISTGRFNTFIICTNNTLWGWGANNWGQLGNGTFEQSLYPVKIKDDVISVITNHDFALVITKDDTLWGWGHNSGNQLLTGDFRVQPYPVQLKQNIYAVSLGGSFALGTHILAITKEGHLYSWGSNYWGQLGKGMRNEILNQAAEPFRITRQ